MQLSLRKFFVFALIACVVAAGIGFVASVQSRIQFWYRGNSISWVGQMVVEHLKNNDNKWPISWNDLEDDYAPVVRQYGQPWTFEGLKENVEIDWSFNNALDDPAWNVDRTLLPLKMTIESDVFTERETEANEMVFDYLDSLSTNK